MMDEDISINSINGLSRKILLLHFSLFFFFFLILDVMSVEKH